MNSNQSVEEKLRQQYKLAEFQRRMLVRELYQMIDVLEQRPRVRLRQSFPVRGFGTSHPVGVEHNRKEMAQEDLGRMKKRTKR